MNSEKKSQYRNSLLTGSLSSTSESTKVVWLDFFKIQEKIQQERLSIRKNLQTNAFNFYTVISFLPFAVGLVKFLSEKYQYDIRAYVFEKNLPSNTKLSETLNWDTLNFIDKRSNSVIEDHSLLTLSRRGILDFFQDKEVLENLSSPPLDILETYFFGGSEKKFFLTPTQKLQVSFSENFLLLNKNIFLNLLGEKKFASYLICKNRELTSSRIGLYNNFFKLDSEFESKKFQFSKLSNQLPNFLESFFLTDSNGRGYLTPNRDDFKNALPTKVSVSENLQTNIRQDEPDEKPISKSLNQEIAPSEYLSSQKSIAETLDLFPLISEQGIHKQSQSARIVGQQKKKTHLKKQSPFIFSSLLRITQLNEKILGAVNNSSNNLLVGLHTNTRLGSAQNLLKDPIVSKSPPVEGSSEFKQVIKNSDNSEFNELVELKDDYYSDLLFVTNHLKTFCIQKTLLPDTSLQDDSLEEEIEKNSSKITEKINSQLGEKRVVSFFNSKTDEILKDNLKSVLMQIDSLTLLNDVLSSRKMSGYRYPDMSPEEIYWFLIKSKYISHNKDIPLKIQLPSIFSRNIKYKFSCEPLPSFLVSIKSQTLSDVENHKIIFRGRSLVLNQDTGFDWETKISNETPSPFTYVRSWFELYLSQTNPLIQNTHKFLLSNSSDFRPNVSEKLKESFTQAKWIRELPFYSRSFLPDSEINFYPTGFYPGVPFFSPAELKSLVSEFKIEIQEEDENKKETVIPPVVEIKIPKFDQQNLKTLSFSFFTTPNTPPQKTTVNYFLFPIFQSGRVGKLDYDFSFIPFQNYPFSNQIVSKDKNLLGTQSSLFIKNQSLVNTEKFSNIFVSGQYQKFPSIFSKKAVFSKIKLKLSKTETKKLHHSFFDNWESLTFHSWLIVSQMSFAFFFFKTLKAVADNYGRELLVYILDIVASLGVVNAELKEQLEILIGERTKGFRIISKCKKTFNNIAGFQTFLPQISEIIWFLRNSARDFPLSETVPKALLLSGPPGTGKTLLVQALAGEAEVPVLVLAGSSLIEPNESGTVKLEMLFEEARRLAPCIVFIDEIDSLGKKREQRIQQSPMVQDQLYESITQAVSSKTNQFFLGHTRTISDMFIKPNKISTQSQNLGQEANQQLKTFILNQMVTGDESRKRQLALLVRLLVELDGIKRRDGVIVIGATNRIDILDQALLRPGRFEKTLELHLPDTEKRIDILKFYGQHLGYQSLISWDYLAHRTAGFSAAELATIMNESSLKAIMMESQHTVETIEHGIDRITNSVSDKIPNVIAKKDNILPTNSTRAMLNWQPGTPSDYHILLMRLAYYQVGKTLLNFILPSGEKTVVVYLWPRRNRSRSLRIAKTLQYKISKYATRSDLEKQVITSYGGKAGEILFLQSLSIDSQVTNQNEKKEATDSRIFSGKKVAANLSNLGIDDCLFAQTLIFYITQNWNLYSKKSALQESVRVSTSLNSHELKLQKREFYNQLSKRIKKPFYLFDQLVFELDTCEYTHFDAIYYTYWWKNYILSQLAFVEDDPMYWYRLYLPILEKTLLNPEWVPPDQFYHSNRMLNTLSTKKSDIKKADTKSRVRWNDINVITRDYQSHSLVLQSFNLALSVLDSNRELVDQISIQLLHNEILRQPVLSQLIKNFSVPPFLEEKLSKEQDERSQFLKVFQNDESKIIDSSWGLGSRKKLSRWIDFNHLN